jgi:hypothetical protein
MQPDRASWSYISTGMYVRSLPRKSNRILYITDILSRTSYHGHPIMAECMKHLPSSHGSIARYLDHALPRLKVHDITHSFASRIYEALVEARSTDDALYAKLMLDNLCPGNSERRNLHNIHNMSYSSSQSQLTLEGPIREALDRCRSKLRAEELEEIDNIAQWMDRATMRPLFLSEICSALGLLPPSREDEIAL